MKPLHQGLVKEPNTKELCEFHLPEVEEEAKLKEVRLVVTFWEQGEYRLSRCRRKPGVMEMFYILIWVVVAYVYTYVK